VARFTGGAIGDCIVAPVFLMGTSRRVMYANPAANKILYGRYRLKLEAGRLIVTDSGLSSQFQSVVEDLASNGRLYNAAIPLPVVQGGMRAVLHLTSTNGDEAEPESNQALIGIISCAQELEAADLSRLRQTLGLSEVEAEIAAQLLVGRSPREIARRRDSSEQTVRWHIKNMHSKTPTCRLTELVLQVQAVRSPF
jgi:DNA-binding CsgD family transcriptional regulator